MKPISIKQKLSLFNVQWTPKKIGELNGQQVLLAKLTGPFIWHSHEKEDELFYVIKGILTIAFRDSSITLNPGELCIIPRGVEHKPIADGEVHVMLFEPLGIKHTGNIDSDRTVHIYESI